MGRINKKATSKTLIKNTGIIAIGQLSTKLVNFFLLPLYTALLTKNEYGMVDLLSTYASFISVIVGLQMSQGIFRFLVTCREDKESVKKIVSTVVAASGIIFIIYCGVFLGIQSFINLDYKWYLLGQVIALIYLNLTSNIVRGLGNNTIFAIGNFISAIITLLLNVITIVILRMGVSAMLLAYMVGPILGGTFLIIKSKSYRYMSVSYAGWKEFKMIIKYSVPLVYEELSWSVIHTSDRMIVSAILTVAANGLIAVASKFSAIYTTVFSIFNTSWTEQVVLHYKDEGGPEYISDMFNKAVNLFALLAIGIIAVMPIVFDFFVNEQFSQAYNLIPIYMIAVFFNAVIGIISPIYFINNDTKTLAISTAVAATVNMIADLALIKYIGVYAAPISSICGYVTISLWRYYDINKRHLKIRLSIKKILYILIVLTITLFSYYSGFLFLQIVCLGALLIFITIVYWDWLKAFLTIIKNRILSTVSK